MKKTSIKELAPRYKGKGLVWEQFVNKLALLDDMEFWAAQESKPIPQLPPLKYKKPKHNLVSILMP